jgi:citronellol/citronellal dehydrogenase
LDSRNGSKTIYGKILIGEIMSLKDKVIFVSGGSRGIGLAIAKKAAQDGAKLALAAKTADPHPKLPGTIYTAAEEIAKAGGEALPLICDIRDEDNVREVVNQTVEHFGGIDICINNASAIQLTNTMDTEMKRYDLMHQINGRGTYMVSRYCLPHLLKAENPHILNLSPPLDMSAKWFAGHTAYTMAKYNMSMCVLGMAEEFKDRGVAVNAIWPRTAIATAAVQNHLGGDEIMRLSRTPEIMADAAYEILIKDSKEFTGNFCIDDVVLHEAGVQDFSKYASVPFNELMPDFFVPDDTPLPEDVKNS